MCFLRSKSSACFFPSILVTVCVGSPQGAYAILIACYPSGVDVVLGASCPRDSFMRLGPRFVLCLSKFVVCVLFLTTPSVGLGSNLAKYWMGPFSDVYG